MAPQQLEKIESGPGNGRASEAWRPLYLVRGRAADRALRLTKRWAGPGLTESQKKAPNALKTLDAGLKSAPSPTPRRSGAGPDRRLSATASTAAAEAVQNRIVPFWIAA